MKRGLLESRALVVPAGGWDLSITDDGGGPYAVTVPAGTYSPRTLCDAIDSVCESASGLDYTVQISINESTSTGGVVFRPEGATFSATFTDTDLRDVLGFTGNIPNMATADLGSTYGIKGLWLPDCPMLAPYRRGDPGHTVNGPTQTISPLGVTKTIVRPTHVRTPPIRWTHVSGARARQEAESGAPRSFERFVRDTMFGAVSYFTPGGTWRLYWDADSLGTYTDYRPIAPRTTALTRVVEGWSGLYECSFEGIAV